jgi:hypothetical protein
MKPTNYQERNHKIILFCAFYFSCLLLLTYWLTLLFISVPKTQAERQEAGKAELRMVLDYSDKADSLTLKIQKQSNLNIKKLAPFFKWTNDLKEAYPQPFYRLVISSYADLINETVQSRHGDSSLANAKEKIVGLRREELALRKENEALKEQLRIAKSSK